jgi:hypothetical protein
MKSFPLLYAAICAVALSAEATKAANAITITETINFTASGFSPFALVDPVIGSFTITLDPAVPVPPPTMGTTITLNNVNIMPSANPLFF